MGKPEVSRTVKNTEKPEVSRKSLKMVENRQKQQKWHFRQKLWWLGRHFRQKVSFWHVHFWPLRNGSFRQSGILDLRLYSKEAWWTVLGLSDTWSGHPDYRHGVVRGGWYPGNGVWGHGTDPSATPWYGSGSTSPLKTKPFLGKVGKFHDFQWFLGKVGNSMIFSDFSEKCEISGFYLRKVRNFRILSQSAVSSVPESGQQCPRERSAVSWVVS